jgi:hypothetical protein
MGERGRNRFEEALTERIDGTQIVEIETVRRSGDHRRTAVWVVTDGRDVYVRSVRGTRGRWYVDFVERPEGMLHVGDESVPVRAVAATDPASVELVSDLFRMKYRRQRASTESMIQPKTLETTLRLEPLAG